MSRSTKTSKNSPPPDLPQMGLFPDGSLPVGLAKTSPLRAREMAWTAHAAAYGSTSPELLASYDQKDSCWRTPQTSLLSTEGETSDESSGSWPRSGTMLSGTAYRLPPLTHPTSVIASGSSQWWPTLIAQDAKNDGGPSQYERNSLPLNVMVKLYPTLRATDGERGGRGELLHTMKGAETPRGPLPMFPTLRAADARGGARVDPDRPAKEGVKLLEQIRMLPTLTASRRSGLQSHGHNAILGSLNPTWCEWFMGLPIGWTESAVSETSTRRSSRK